MATFVPFININTQISPDPTSGTVSKRGMLIGQRKLTDGKIVKAAAGYTQPNYYVPIALPSFVNGGAALEYLDNLGFTSTLGINFTLALVHPDTVTPANGLTTLMWDTEPAGFAQLLDFNLSGTLTQAVSLVSASVRRAYITTDNKYAITVNGTPSPNFDTTNALTLAGINNVNYPDPNLTDPVALMVWDYYQTATSAFASPFGAPATYISVLSDRDTTITPSSTPIDLIAPTTATAGVNDTATLLYSITADNLGYLPTTVWGTSAVEQGTATGIYNGYTIAGSVVTLNIKEVTGTFNNVDPITITLDDNINCFDYLDNIELNTITQQFAIKTQEDIDVNYADFFEGIATINEANQILNKHYGTYGVVGNVTSMPNQAATLPVANSQNIVLVSYPYVTQFGDIPYENTEENVAAGRFAAGASYMVDNQDTPFNALTSAVIPHFPVSSLASTTSYSSAQEGTGDIAISQGWMPLVPNSQGVVSFLQANTSLITEPNTTTPDIEFRYVSIWSKVRWLRREVANIYTTITTLPNNQGTADLSDALLSQMRVNLISALYQGQQLGLFMNVALYEKLVTTNRDTQNPNQMDAYIPTQIIPQLNGLSALINIFSSTKTNFNAA